MISFELGKSLQQQFVASLPALESLFVYCQGSLGTMEIGSGPTVG